jgi:predicted RNA-binding Zn ribbon-like protein
VALTPKKVSYQLIAGHPVLDFANTLDDRFSPRGPRELLTGYRDLLRFLCQTRMLGGRQAADLAAAAQENRAERALQSARELREATAVACYAAAAGGSPTNAAVRTLEHHFLAARQHQQLLWRHTAKRSEPDGALWIWGRFATELELPVWMLALATADLMMSPSMRWLRACDSDTCRWLFLDATRNHSRRWCDMSICGNRMKARRFQARGKR